MSFGCVKVAARAHLDKSWRLLLFTAPPIRETCVVGTAAGSTKSLSMQVHASKVGSQKICKKPRVATKGHRHAFCGAPLKNGSLKVFRNPRDRAGVSSAMPRLL
jgi:hypothetical protein